MRTFAFLALLVLVGCRFDLPASSPDAIDATVATDATDVSCPSDYGPINGVGMYRVVNQPELVWAAAAADCNDDSYTGGLYSGFTHLLVLRDETERLAITAAGTPIMGNTWIGLSDRGIEGTYIWVTSEPTGSYPALNMRPPWDGGDPDDPDGTEDCVRFKLGFTLEDRLCDAPESYVCECDAYPLD